MNGRATLIKPSTIRYERLLPGPVEREPAEREPVDSSRESVAAGESVAAPGSVAQAESV